MRDRKTRRNVPVVYWTTAACAVLILCEALVVAGGLELKASTVRKHAPWAYEPFLKLVGEHVNSQANLPEVKEAVVETRGAVPSAMATVAGFDPDSITVTIDTGDDSFTNDVPDFDTPATPEPEPQKVPSQESSSEDVVPVG